MNGKKRGTLAVSELIGTILLMLIVVSAFAVIYLNVFSDQGPDPNITVNIVGTIEGETIILEHRGGDPIKIDSQLEYTINNTKYSFAVSEFLENSAMADNLWNIGERCYIPFEYDLDYLENYDTVEISAAEDITNSLIFTGTLDLQPMSDLGVEVSFEPEILKLNDYVAITVVVTCNGGDVGARNIRIQCLLPDGLGHNWNTTTKGTYSDTKGIWTIDKIDIGESATLLVNASVVPIEFRPVSQLAVVLDGSGSISASDWNIVRTGLGNAVANASVFPRDKSVELTVIQFGGYSGSGGYRAETEINQKFISNVSSDTGYYETVSSTIKSMSQFEGGTPTACGIRLGSDKIHDSPFFNQTNRSIVILVTDGKANCKWIPGGYTGEWVDVEWRQTTSEYKSESASAYASSSYDGTLISNEIDTSNASVISVDFWYKLDDTEGYGNDFNVYYFDGTNYDYITSLGGGTENTWLHYQDTTTETQYIHPGFRIRFDCNLEWGENVYVDDVTINSGDSIFIDGFEGSFWDKKWTNPAKLSAEEARQYLISNLQMNSSQDAFNVLAVGTDTELYWLNHSMVWPQPGYQAPPYDSGSGWWSHISSFQEFEVAINSIFQMLFQSRITPVQIKMLEPEDPNLFNDDHQITIIPTD